MVLSTAGFLFNIISLLTEPMVDFLFSNKVGPMGFLGRVILGLVIFLGGADFVHIQSAKRHMPSTSAIVVVTIFGLIAMGGLFYLVRFGVMARLRSTGLSSWFTLLILIPPINVLFLFFLFFCPIKAFAKKKSRR